MIELGQLEKHHGEFDARGVRILAVSLDDVADSQETQTKFPHLTILSDHDESLARAASVIGPHLGPAGEATVSPTTIVFDKAGIVRWVYRPDRFTNRLAPDALLAQIDQLRVTR